MREDYWLDLQYFAEGASAGDGGAAGASSAAAGQSTGETNAAAGQTIEARLEELNVPKDKIRKGAYKSRSHPVNPGSTAPASQEAAVEQVDTPAEVAASERKPWDEVKSDYKAEYDAEMQDTIRKRIKSERDRTQRYIEHETTLAPMMLFFAERWGLDPESDDFYTQMVEKFRADKSLSQNSALEDGLDDEVEHKLKVAKADETAQRLKAKRDQALKAAFDKARGAYEHMAKLNQQAEEFKAQNKMLDFDLDRELKTNNAFVALVQPGSAVTVEQAYYATHPEYRQKEAQSIAEQAAAAVSASVRAGATRPAENGSQAATIGRPAYRDMPKEQREALKRRIREAGYDGRHIPVGG